MSKYSARIWANNSSTGAITVSLITRTHAIKPAQHFYNSVSQAVEQSGNEYSPEFIEMMEVSEVPDDRQFMFMDDDDELLDSIPDGKLINSFEDSEYPTTLTDITEEEWRACFAEWLNTIADGDTINFHGDEAAALAHIAKGPTKIFEPFPTNPFDAPIAPQRYK